MLFKLLNGAASPANCARKIPGPLMVLIVSSTPPSIHDEVLRRAFFRRVRSQEQDGADNLVRLTHATNRNTRQHALHQRCQEIGFQLSKPELDDLYLRFTAVADHRKKGLMDEEIVALIKECQKKALGVAAD